MAMMDISGSCRPMTWQWRALDSTLCLLLFFPSMLFYWRGIWDLYGVYIFPNDEFASNWAVFGLGCTAILGYVLHPGLGAALNEIRRGNDVGPGTEDERRHVITVVDNVDSPPAVTITTKTLEKVDVVKSNGRSPRRKLYRVVYVLSTRFYMCLFGVSAMAYWRGVWLLVDYYIRDVDRLLGSLVGLVAGYLLLVALRCSRSLIFPPFFVTLDTRPDLLVPSTRFQTKVNRWCAKSVAVYALDSLMTQYVIVTLTIVTWRSTLALYDVVLAFDDPVHADVASTLIGILCCSVMFAVEGVLARFAARWRGWQRLVVDDVITFLLFASEAFLWRGAWNLNARFLIPDPLIGGWTNHVIGTVLLMSFQLLSYVGSCGCSTDGQQVQEQAEPQGDGESGLYPTKYLRHYYVERYLGDTLNTGDGATPGDEGEPLKTTAILSNGTSHA